MPTRTPPSSSGSPRTDIYLNKLLVYSIHMKKSSKDFCEYKNCQFPFYAKSLCRSHYLQQRRGHSLRPAGTRESEFRSSCAVVFCEKLQVSTGKLCRSHRLVCASHHISQQKLIETVNHGCDSCLSLGRVEVDHDHACCDSGYSKCGLCVRGALCRSCNQTLAYLEVGRTDTPRVLELMAELSIYLKKNMTVDLSA